MWVDLALIWGVGTMHGDEMGWVELDRMRARIYFGTRIYRRETGSIQIMILIESHYLAVYAFVLVFGVRFLVMILASYCIAWVNAIMLVWVDRQA